MLVFNSVIMSFRLFWLLMIRSQLVPILARVSALSFPWIPTWLGIHWISASTNVQLFRILLIVSSTKSLLRAFFSVSHATLLSVKTMGRLTSLAIASLSALSIAVSSTELIAALLASWYAHSLVTTGSCITMPMPHLALVMLPSV
uniref:Putative secreted protein n=1 Tax=Anopheles triannulatus TaxID=58253 RepID=A0A2M4B2A0_9DIPT